MATAIAAAQTRHSWKCFWVRIVVGSTIIDDVMTTILPPSILECILTIFISIYIVIQLDDVNDSSSPSTKRQLSFLPVGIFFPCKETLGRSHGLRFLPKPFRVDIPSMLAGRQVGCRRMVSTVSPFAHSSNPLQMELLKEMSFGWATMGFRCTSPKKGRSLICVRRQSLFHNLCCCCWWLTYWRKTVNLLTPFTHCSNYTSNVSYATGSILQL
jgi:hypothetical protein